MSKINIKILAKYSDQYIAFSKNRSSILAFGKSIKELEEKLKEKKIKHAIIHYVPPVNVAFSPLCR